MDYPKNFGNFAAGIFSIHKDEPMRFSVEQDNDIVIFTLKEPKLDGVNAPDVKAEFLIICQPNVEALVIDLANVGECDNNGVSALLLANRLMKEHDAPVFLTGVSEQVRSLLELSMVAHNFEFRESVEETLTEFSDAEEFDDEY
jgi:anti-anti-sigma factor